MIKISHSFACICGMAEKNSLQIKAFMFIIDVYLLLFSTLKSVRRGLYDYYSYLESCN